MRLNLPLYSYQLRSRPASPARLVNCFPEILPAGAKTPVTITRAPGIKAWTTVGTGPIYGMYANAVEFASGRQDYLYVVSGSEWYYVNSSGVATLIGDIGTPNRIDMDSNSDTVVLVNEPRAYYWDGATFGEITDDDFVSRGAGDVEFLDKFLAFREPNSSRWFIADIGSATSFDALQFAIADDAPDELVGMKADRGIMINFGVTTTEFWENTGVAGFPFERIINGTIQVGCLNAKTIGRVFDQIIWVADDYTVRHFEGLVPIRISTHAIEQKLSSETSIEAFTYEQEGHFFYCLTTDSGTYTYDIVTQEWSERESYGYANWRPRHHALFAAKQLVGDSDSNMIGWLDFDTATDWGYKSLGLLIDQQDLSASSWTNVRSSETVDAIIAPDGSVTADKLVEDGTATNNHYITQTTKAHTSGATITVGIFAQAAERDWFAIYEAGSADGRYFDLSTSALGSVLVGAPAASKITHVGGGWYLCQITVVATGTTSEFRFHLSDGDAGLTYSGDGSSGTYLWGVHGNEGTVLNRYLSDTQRMEWTYQPVYATGQRAFHDRFEIILETGVGATIGQGSDPKIMLQYSDDGGKTWISLPDKSLGALGERFTRAIWYNLGSSRQRVYRAAVSDPIPITVVDTILEVKGGRL